MLRVKNTSHISNLIVDFYKKFYPYFVTILNGHTTKSCI